MLAKVTSAAIVGLTPKTITVEVDIASQGLPQFIIVGLPGKAVDEARERVKSAIRNSGFEFPNKKITVNLAPGDIQKEGSRYDLPIAIGILISSNQIKAIPQNTMIYGELALDGAVRPCSGAVLCTILAKESKYEEVIVPDENAKEAALIEGPKIFPCKTLKQLVEHFNGLREIKQAQYSQKNQNSNPSEYDIDFADIHGQMQGKRALEICAAGGHNMIMIGSPGAGKTMLARAFPSILPDITPEESLELTKLYSITGKIQHTNPLIQKRPFRNPHHTSSVTSLIGGGSIPKPGEISLAHRGVLFLDEFLEFPKTMIESLRQPLEDGEITIARAATTITYPAKFILLAACNPCPCGYAFNDNTKQQCNCTTTQIQKYRKRMSGPILDRIDIQVIVKPVPIKDFIQANKAETSQEIKKRVQTARNRQKERFKNANLLVNAEMKTKDIKKYCNLEKEAQKLLENAIEKLSLSARGYYRIIKIAQTIADLQNEEMITTKHIAESLQYRFANI